MKCGRNSKVKSLVGQGKRYFSYPRKTGLPVPARESKAEVET